MEKEVMDAMPLLSLLPYDFVYLQRYLLFISLVVSALIQYIEITSD
jgi:hypothetical protein